MQDEAVSGTPGCTIEDIVPIELVDVILSFLLPPYPPKGCVDDDAEEGNSGWAQGKMGYDDYEEVSWVMCRFVCRQWNRLIRNRLLLEPSVEEARGENQQSGDRFAQDTAISSSFPCLRRPEGFRYQRRRKAELNLYFKN